jgi:hypothetical protein
MRSSVLANVLDCLEVCGCWRMLTYAYAYADVCVCVCWRIANVLDCLESHLWITLKAQRYSNSNWRSPGSRQPKAMQSNDDHDVSSNLFSSKRKWTPGGYHAVCVHDVALSCFRSSKPFPLFILLKIDQSHAINLSWSVWHDQIFTSVKIIMWDLCGCGSKLCCSWLERSFGP